MPFKVETFACATSVITVPEYMYYYRLQRPGQDVACTDERLYVHFDIFNHLDKSIGGYRDQHLLDYLQVVKFQTHLYAYDKIDSKFARVYYKRMMTDLHKNMGIGRTICLLGDYLGRRKQVEFLLLAFHMPFIYKLYRKNSISRDLKRLQGIKKKEEQLKNLCK